MNGAAIGIAPSEIETMTWWRYNGIVSVYNERMSPEAAEAEAPDADFVARQMAAAERRGLARSIH